MKHLVLVIPLLILYGCGGSNDTSPPQDDEESNTTELLRDSTLAETTLANATQLYLPLKYLATSHSSLQRISADSQNDFPISFNNKLSITPASKNKVMCQNGGWKQQVIKNINYRKKYISGLIKYYHCNEGISIHGTKKIEYTLNNQNQLSSYSESYPSDFSIADVNYAAGSQISYDHFHYSNQILDKYNATYTQKITINNSGKKYILGFKDLTVVYDISNSALTFNPLKGKIFIKDASKYFEVDSTDSSPVKLTQGKYLSSGNISFTGAEDKSFVVQSTKKNLLSFLITDKQEQTDLSW